MNQFQKPKTEDLACFEDLVALMSRLRAPNGCPWDRDQTYATLAPMLLEEAYEAFEAVEKGQNGLPNDLRDELGDLLFQIVFFAHVAKERGDFDIDAVINTVHAKMVRRHPHVFGDTEAKDAAEVLRNWEAIKAEEKKARKDDIETSILDGVPAKAPALMEAHQLSTKAARVGFDWKNIADIFDKIHEELGELKSAIEAHERSREESDHVLIRGEVGDLLFAVTNLARRLKVEPEAALKLTNRKFRRRFKHIEGALSESGRSFESTSLEELEELWQAAKSNNEQKEGPQQGGPSFV